MMDGPKEDEARPIMVEQKEEPTYCMTIEEDEGNNGESEWYSDILQYLKDGIYPKSTNKNDQLTIRRLSTNYIIYGERLYKRSYDGIHLLCNCQWSTANNWRGSWVKLWATYECTHAVKENNETRLLLDYYRSRLCGSCLKMPLMPSPWGSKTHATQAITYHDITLAILYIGDRYYWEDSPNSIQWPWIHTCCYRLFH